MSKPIRFERQYFPKYRCTVVALDARLQDFQGIPEMRNGKLMVRLPEKTIKDCRGIDGCLYMCLGHVPEIRMTQLIELYQKAAQSEKWHENHDLVIPDDKFNLGL